MNPSMNKSIKHQIMPARKPYTLDRIFRMLLSLAGAILLYLIIVKLSPYLAPFFIALLLAYLFNPVVEFFQKKFAIKNRVFAVVLALSYSLLLILLAIALLSPILEAEVNQAMDLINSYYNVGEFQNKVSENIQKILARVMESEKVQEILNSENFGEMGQLIWDWSKRFLSGIGGILGLLVTIISVGLYLFFILIYFREIEGSWAQLIPRRYRKLVTSLVVDVEEGMRAYFRSQTRIVLIVALLFAIGFSIVGLPLAIVFGVFVGFLNYVPYLQLVGLLPAVLLAFLKSVETGQPFWIPLLAVLAVFAVVQLIQEILLIPKIMGNLTGLNPAIILLSLSVWGGMLGIVGMIIALPFTTLLISYYKRYVLKNEKVINTT